MPKFFGKKNPNGEQENISKISSDKAKEIIKTLSGGEIRYTKKVIDNVIIFSGAQGGTGASTLLANVAYLAASKNLRVLVIDLNVMYPTQHIYFGKEHDDLQPPDLMSFLTGKNPIGESIENDGLVSLLYANNRTLMDSLISESDISVTNFTNAIQRLRQLFDLILIDCPMKIDHTLYNTAYYLSDSIYLVWDEGISSITNTEKIRRNMVLSGVEVFTKMKVILNKRTNIHYNNYPFQKLNVELVQILPFEPDVIYSSLRSEVFCDKGASKSKNADIFYAGMVELTDKILENGGYIK